MKRWGALGLALMVGLAGPAAAEFQPQLLGTPVQTAERAAGLTSFRLPIGPWASGQLPQRDLEGAVWQRAWRIPLQDFTTLSLLTPLRDQLAAEGWQVLFACETEDCGGFDFRYGIEIFPEPDMHIDLTDFRVLSATKDGAKGAEHLMLVISRAAQSGFVQVTHIGPAEAEAPSAPAPAAPTPAAPPASAPTPSAHAPGAFTTALQGRGVLVLEDLVFASGKAELAPGDYASLTALAAFLAEDPSRKIALVGHTDATGTQEANLALSRARAAAVRARLVEGLGVDGARIYADGVGFLAPRASNLTPEGRQENRRVEVILIGEGAG
jgi:outer membrane protein OmpA-like peptidoglycan-associated protein